MEATLMLCDFAEALNGKLYVMGGGWTLYRSNEPISFGLAILLSVPWSDTNRKHRLRVGLRTEDGETVVDAGGQPVGFDGEFEVGRPPGITPGDDIVSPMTFRFQGVELNPGGYRVELTVDDVESAHATFRMQREG